MSSTIKAWWECLPTIVNTQGWGFSNCDKDVPVEVLQRLQRGVKAGVKAELGHATALHVAWWSLLHESARCIQRAWRAYTDRIDIWEQPPSNMGLHIVGERHSHCFSPPTLAKSVAWSQQCPLTRRALNSAELLRIDHAAMRHGTICISGWLQAKRADVKSALKTRRMISHAMSTHVLSLIHDWELQVNRGNSSYSSSMLQILEELYREMQDLQTMDAPEALQARAVLEATIKNAPDTDGSIAKLVVLDA